MLRKPYLNLMHGVNRLLHWREGAVRNKGVYAKLIELEFSATECETWWNFVIGPSQGGKKPLYHWWQCSRRAWSLKSQSCDKLPQICPLLNRLRVKQSIKWKTLQLMHGILPLDIRGGARVSISWLKKSNLILGPKPATEQNKAVMLSKLDR